MSDDDPLDGAGEPVYGGPRFSVPDGSGNSADIPNVPVQPAMPEDLITPQNLSIELIKSILDAAYFEVSYDSDGDLQVQEEIKVYVVPARESKDRIGLQAIFGFKPESTEYERLEFVNQINTEYAIIRASSRQNNTLHFSYDILIAGGVTKKAFVLALKRFCTIPRATIREYGREIVG